MRLLTRTITRRIENLVVSLTPEGIVLRKFRKRAKQNAKLVTWADLALAAGANIRTTRQDAFQYAPMAGWVPKPLDQVYLHRKHKAARGVVIHIHPALPEPLVTVEVRSGTSRLVPLSELRPAPVHLVQKRTGGQKEFASVE
jgi:hypothetical protein